VRHVIQQQIMEVTIDREDAAYALQNELSRIFHARLMPLIDQIFSEYSTPDTLHRIDSLVLDVGQLNLDNLENELVEKIAALLPAELAHALPSETAAADADLIVYFAFTGTLPWWASGAEILTEVLRRLLNTDRLRPALSTITRSETATQRLVRHLDDEILAAVCESILPSGNFQIWTDRFDRILRHHFWANLLRAISHHPRPSIEALYSSVLRQTAADAGISVADISKHLDLSKPFSRRQILGKTAAEVSTSDPLKTNAPSEISNDDALLLRDLQSTVQADEGEESFQRGTADLSEIDALLDPLPPDLRAEISRIVQLASQPVEIRESIDSFISETPDFILLLAQLPDSLRDAVLRILPIIRFDEARMIDFLKQLLSISADHITTIVEIFSRLRPESESSHLPLPETLIADNAPENAIDLRFSDPNQAPNSRIDLRFSDLNQATDDTIDLRFSDLNQATDDTIDLRFSDSEAAYIENAGLVILWPFLTQFFTNLDLVVDRQFKDESSRQRAVGLLHLLATGQADFPEFMLPLNKVLCGMPPETLFEFGDPVSDLEIDSCDALLEAVIAQATALREMTVMGLRGTFLLRRGVLRVEAGGWLLRVERETYDVVLDQFPWGWGWLRLPWMDAPLRVEW